MYPASSYNGTVWRKELLQTTSDKQLKGIRGWLVLPALGLIFLPIILVVSIFQVAEVIGTAEPALGSILVFEVVANAAFLALVLYVAYHFFKESMKAPKLVILMYIFGAAITFVDALLVDSLGILSSDEVYSDFIQAAIAALIWIPYFMKSVRVKNTFINRI